ncbi:TRAP transporter small permease [Denitromonas sp. IR12]|uniref:TRAP transporter small permease protein n=2 Tax=Denitromonas iodatirespirans TaxID=2795389 RepID=A0A944DF46_DENI1|nr:TRAP transporter small permease [Denitromonas iodatirespirans]
MVLVVALIMVEIVLRGAFATSTFIMDEFVGYGVAAITFLSLGYALESGSLIRVNVLLTHLGNGIVRRLVEAFCVGTTLALAVFIAWYFWKSVARSWARGSVSETVAQVPLWIPEGLVLIGLSIFALQLLAYLLRVLTGGQLIGDDITAEGHGE